MAAAVFRAAGAKSEGTTGTVTVAAPTGVATGDLEILMTESAGSDTVSITNNGGGAWTALTGSPVTPALTTLNVWWRIRAGGDGDPVVQAASNHVCAGRICYQAGTFDATTPIEIPATGSEAVSDTSYSFAPGTSTSGADRLVLSVSTCSASSATGQVPVCTNANLTSLNSRINISTTSGNGGGFGVTEGTLAAAGAVGTFACTYANAGNKAYASFAIAPLGAQVVPLNTSAGQSAATLAASATTRVPLATSPAASAPTLALTATTRVVLAASSAVSASTLAVTATTQVPLGASAAQSFATAAPTTPRPPVAEIVPATPAVLILTPVAAGAVSIAAAAPGAVVLTPDSPGTVTITPVSPGTITLTPS